MSKPPPPRILNSGRQCDYGPLLRPSPLVLHATGAIYAFSHQDGAVAHSQFVTLTLSGCGDGDDPAAATTRLTLTSSHYLYVGGVLRPASEAKAGDEVACEGDRTGKVVAAESGVKGKGLFNPHTLHGDLVVDGVHTSTYTTAMSPTLAHALLWPFRAAYSSVGVSATPALLAAAARLGFA